MHLKNKGDLPEEAVKPVPTVGMPSKLTGLLWCFADLLLASMAVEFTKMRIQLLHTILVSKNSILYAVTALKMSCCSCFVV